MPRDWDEHYTHAANLDWTPDPLLVQTIELLPPGRALDLACGNGRNTIHLARLGWTVTAVDSSPQAIRLLRERVMGLPVDSCRADLERGEFIIEPDAYDLIADFYYLQRDLFAAIRAGVRTGGVFTAAIRLTGSFCVQPGELLSEFAEWKVLYYSEAAGSAKIIARKA